MSTDTSTQHEQDVSDDNQRVQVEASDIRIGANGRITIPERKRKRYDIEQGDYVDITITLEKTEEEVGL